jgi:hypothetical protein
MTPCLAMSRQWEFQVPLDSALLANCLDRLPWYLECNQENQEGFGWFCYFRLTPVVIITRTHSEVFWRYSLGNIKKHTVFCPKSKPATMFSHWWNTWIAKRRAQSTFPFYIILRQRSLKKSLAFHSPDPSLGALGPQKSSFPWPPEVGAWRFLFATLLWHLLMRKLRGSWIFNCAER